MRAATAFAGIDSRGSVWKCISTIGAVPVPLRLWSRAGRYRHLIVIAIMWLYALLTGFMPSVVRAAVMIIGHAAVVGIDSHAGRCPA